MVTYDRYDITFQEVPNEVSLSFSVEGCPNRCIGCHSPHLREQNGEELNIELLDKLFEQYKMAITCVLFLGGDGFHNEIYLLAEYCQSKGFKTAIYSGNDVIDEKLFDVFNYYKIGSYQEKLGALNSISTNQRMYLYDKNSLKDITSNFWERKI